MTNEELQRVIEAQQTHAEHTKNINLIFESLKQLKTIMENSDLRQLPDNARSQLTRMVKLTPVFGLMAAYLAGDMNGVLGQLMNSRH